MGSRARTTSTVTGLGSPQQLRDLKNKRELSPCQPEAHVGSPPPAPQQAQPSSVLPTKLKHQQLILRMPHHSPLFKVSSSEVLCRCRTGSQGNTSYDGGIHSYLIYNTSRSLIIMMSLKINTWLDMHSFPIFPSTRTLPVSKPITAQYTHRLSST